jgi:hypothetical protein
MQFRSGLVRPRGTRLTVSLVVAAVAILLMTALPAEAATASPYNTNLVKNPGAEQGPASSDGQSGVAIPGWEPFGNFTVVAYGTAGGFPTAHEGARISGLHKFFTTGAYDTIYGECDSAVQFITIGGHNSAIDSGHVKVVLSARIGTYGSQPDTAHVTLSFRDGNNEQLTTAQSGSLALTPVSATKGVFKLETASKVLPSKARILRITLSADRTVGYCDAYFDNISIKIVHF